MEAQLEQSSPINVAFKTVRELFKEGQEKQQDQCISHVAPADQDIMQYHEAIRKPDIEELLEGMQEEVQSHTNNDVWELIPKSKLLPDTPILPAV